MLRSRPSISSPRCATRRGRHVFAALVATLTLLLGSVAWADDPCADLNDADAAKYADLNTEMVKQYKAKDWQGTVKVILALRGVCDEDPTIVYNLARAYHKAENCNQALFWYEAVQNYSDPRFAALVTSLRNEAALKVAELEMECSTSARVSVQCSDDDVWVTIGEEQARPCPFEDRLEAGKYKMRAVKQGLEPYELNVALKAGEANTLIVPKLNASTAQGPDTGTLQISCPQDVSSIAFRGPRGLEEVNCPFERSLPPGTYQIGFSGTEPTEPVSIAAGKTVALELSELGLQPVKPLGVLIGLRALPGLGLGSGDLYVEGFQHAKTQGMQPSGLTFGVVVEAGYAINDMFAVLLQGRIDVMNFAAIGGAVFRYTALNIDAFSVRVDAGVGYGELQLPMENDLLEADFNITTGPAYGNVGGSVAWNVASSFAVVLDVGTRVGFPDFGLQVDSGVGIELKF